MSWLVLSGKKMHIVYVNSAKAVAVLKYKGRTSLCCCFEQSSSPCSYIFVLMYDNV
jgi:hypothetical protein